MQNKGALTLLTVVLAIACAFQLSFTFVARNVERKAATYAAQFPGERQAQMEQKYLDSVKAKDIYLGFTYKQVKDLEINLGLDLKGGMNVMLEISVEDVVRALSNHSQDPVFNQALAQARSEAKTSADDFISLFAKAYAQLSNNAPLAFIFNTHELHDKVKPTSTNEQVIAVLRSESESAISNSYNVLRSRIDRFGVANPNIQRIGNTGRILVELPGVKEPERVRKLLQGTASLEFWITYSNPEFFPYLEQANSIIYDLNQAGRTEAQATGETAQATGGEGDLMAELTARGTGSTELEEFNRLNPLFAKLTPAFSQTGQLMLDAIIGHAMSYDTAAVNAMLSIPQVRMALPRDARLMWGVKAVDDAESIFPLYAIRANTRDGQAPLDGAAVADARANFANNSSLAEVDMVMTPQGAKTWARLTGDNVGNFIAIVLDGYVYSAPRVNQEISGGRSQITGGFSIAEATDLANVLKSGKLPAPARITQEAVVGPSLGQESIESSMVSFALAFIIVLLYMMLFYKKAGWVASIALVTNLFFLLGILVGLKAVLTLPGIAGIVLTMGMAIDANVIIYERVKEELRGGKALGAAIAAGYKNAMSAIIDANITSFMTGLILFVFGTGPVQGFATTLMIGIVTSFFTSIFITRLIFAGMLKREKKITFSRRWNEYFLANINIDFIKKSKLSYIITTLLILVSVASLATQGMNMGVDFTGGRTFVVRFDRPVAEGEVRDALGAVFTDESTGSITVTRFGAVSQQQMRIGTQYMYDDASEDANSIVEGMLYQALEPVFAERLTLEEFQSTATNPYGIISADMVGPSVASDITRNSFIAVIICLIAIGLYIILRFKRWQWGVGSIIALTQDAFLTIGMFSLFYKVLPFNLEVNQAFIAAILTIVGYSINDKVVIFDRIREYGILFPKRNIRDNINYAVNSTMSRTINTSGSTFLVLLAIFLFGGEVIRGFIFALMFGVLIGTVSSVFTATPASYQLIKRRGAKKAMYGTFIISAVVLLAVWALTPLSFAVSVIVGALAMLTLIYLLVVYYVITDREETDKRE